MVQKAEQEIILIDGYVDVSTLNLFFLILDGKTVYHIGASLKDAGKKCFAVSEMKDAGRSLMKKLAGVK